MKPVFLLFLLLLAGCSKPQEGDKRVKRVYKNCIKTDSSTAMGVGPSIGGGGGLAITATPVSVCTLEQEVFVVEEYTMNRWRATQLKTLNIEQAEESE